MIRKILATLALLAGLAASVAAQAVPPARWELHTRLLATGTSRGSEPVGFKVYTAFPIEVAVRRDLGAGRLRLELAVRNESREVDQAGTPEAVRWGSIEVIPVNLMLQVRLRTAGGVRPYVGAGVNATIAWEKAGTIDSMTVSPSVGPALGAGLDVPLGGAFAFNVDFRWHTWTTDLATQAGARVARLLVDPSSLGVGIAARF